MSKIGCNIKIGDYVEALIHVVTLGFGKSISSWIAVDLLGYKSCGCEERRIWLNKLTCKENNDGIKIQ
jgi:hypothetical protein